MTVTSNYSQAADVLTVSVTGNFGFDSHKDFRATYADLPPSSARKYIIDLSQVSYMDSAALGMLLVLRERSGGDASNITLKGATDNVQKILDISRFEQLFSIE